MNEARVRRAATVGVTSAICGVLLAGGLVACGKVATKNQVSAAKDNLMNATSASFTLHLDDPKHEYTASVKDASDKEAAKVGQDSTLTLTVDPHGDQTIGSVSSKSTPPSQNLTSALKNSGSYNLTWAYKGKELITLRSIDGVGYARINAKNYDQSSANAVVPLGLVLFDLPTQTPAQVAAMDGLRSGKWVSLDLAHLYAKAKSAGEFGEPTKDGAASESFDPNGVQAIGRKLVDAVQQHTTYTTTKNGSTVVVSMKVDAKGAASGILPALKGTPAEGIVGRPSSASDVTVPAGTVDASITTTDEHLTKLDLDLGSALTLAKSPDAKTITTAKLAVDVNDHAAPVTAPSPDQVVKADVWSDALGK